MLKYFPEQKKSFKSKGKEWRKNSVDYICSQIDEEYNADWQRMQENYNLHNNVVSQEEFKRFCDPLNLDASGGQDYVQIFNLIPKKIDVLVGEELKRPWNYTVISVNREAANEVLRDKERDFRDYVDFQLQKEVERSQARIQQEMALKSQEMTDKDAERQMKALEEELQAKEAEILNPQQIEKKYKNYKTTKETSTTFLLKHLTRKLRLKHKKNLGFFHANVSGLEAVELRNNSGELELNNVNSLGLGYHKSPESQFIQDGDYAVYKREMTIADVMDYYGDMVSDKEMKLLRDYVSNVHGLDAKLMSKTGWSPSHWEHTKDKNFPGDYGTSNVPQLGQFGQSRADDDYLTVYTCYWKSQRKVIFLEFINEYGDTEVDIFGEEYEIPEDAVEVIEKRTIGKNRKYLVFEEDGVEYKAETRWIEECWIGERIDQNVFVNIRPMATQLRSKSNPRKVKLPIFGTAYNNVNAPITCTTDYMKPWQKLYFFVASKWMKLIAQDKSVVHLINTLMIDGEIGFDKSMQYLTDMGMLPFNPLANAEGAAFVQNMKVGEALNLSNAQQLGFYTDILMFIERMIGVSGGVPPEREGQTSKGSNVTDNQQDLIQSAHITEALFASHDLLWQDILNGLVKMAQEMVAKGEFTASRFILSDDEVAILQMNPDEFSDEDFDVIIADNAKAFQDLNLLRAKANEILQNEKKGLSILVKLLGAESIGEFKAYVEEIEEDIIEREAQMQQSQLESQEKIAEMQIENREDEQAARLDEINLKGEWDVRKAEVTAFMGQMDQDINDNQIPDQLEVEKLRTQTQLKQKDQDLKQQDLSLKREKMLRDDDNKKKEIKQRNNQTK